MAAADTTRVLVVDDDSRFAMAVAALLETEGCVVIGRGANGAEGIELVEELSPDIVTMDIDMPVMDGVEAIRRLKEIHPHIPVVVVTGSQSSDRVQEALRGGGAAFVPKARASEELGPALRRVLGDD